MQTRICKNPSRSYEHCCAGIILKFGYSEKATKFEKVFRLKIDVTELRQILSEDFF